MSELTLQVGVIIARRRLSSPWASAAWSAVAVLPSPPLLPAGARVASAEGDDLFYAGAYELTFHRSDTANYRDNLRAQTPMLWVTLAAEGDPPPVVGVTADPYEGEALAEVYADRLDTTPMPLSIREELAQFIERHHVERPFVKRRRD